jgi:uncharacterized protein (TIGR02145 family)
MTYRILLLSIIVFSFVLSCEDEKITNPKPDVVSPHITSIEPDSAYIGDIVTIIGTGFGTTQDTSKVSFTGADATDFISWDSTEIKVNVPTGTQSGKVFVIVNGLKSNEVDFWVKNNPFIKDTVKICNQVWMTKNLDVDHYRNGEPIPEVRDAKEWGNLKTGAWCYYNNDPELGKIYGRLYNWYAVNDPRGLAPEGWHVPSDDEWKQLEICLGMSPSFADEYGYRGTNEGGKLKTIGTIEAGDGLWISPNTGATNESGFSALPGGWRNGNGAFNNAGYVSYYWSPRESGAKTDWVRGLLSGRANIDRIDHSKNIGFSVRCVKD